jgi:hypothetical protein
MSRIARAHGHAHRRFSVVTLCAAALLIGTSVNTARAAGTDLTFTPGSWTVATGTGTIVGNGIPVVVSSSLVVQGDGRTHRVFEVGSLTVDVGADVRVSGAYPAEFRASGPVSVAGTLDASAANGAPGPGAAFGGAGGAPGQGGQSAPGLAGGLGAGLNRCGGLGGIGGIGGDGSRGVNGAPCPTTDSGTAGNGGGGGGGGGLGAVPSFAPGGGGGGGGSAGPGQPIGGVGGAGGGKLVLVSTQSITVGGIVRGLGAPGARGATGSGNGGGGGGGGGGGALAFDAPSVVVAAAAVIDARGGIGGTGGASVSGAGGSGGIGTVFVRATTFTNGGTTFPAPIVSTVPPPNQAPTATEDSYSTPTAGALQVAAPGVLGNDEDPEADSLTAVLESGPAHGDLSLALNGSFTYTPAAGFSGTDHFSYRASDGSATSAPASVSIEVTPPSTTFAATVRPPINADSSPETRSTFSASRGVVPVKFALTADGEPTCDLPPATVAVERLAGAGTEPINESLYTGPSDTGSEFRIADCQYHYNLRSSQLGAGTYRVVLLIGSESAGFAVFDLR